ncbi:MAG: hypothetical protein K2N14_03735 [Clostridia bacterium]|nr:hypothetical protein [Clostridia bacterium]
MHDFEDVMLCDLLKKVQKRVGEISESRKAAEFKNLGSDIQAVYNFFVTSKKDYAEQQEMLKNMFSAFNYAAVIINDAVKNKKTDGETGELLNECLEIIAACCRNVINSLGMK